MIDSAILDGLKRVNVSADKEKTKERIESLWKSLKASERKAFREGTGSHENNIARVRKEGAIMPRLLLSFASHFNIDPAYLSADTDENAGWSEEAMRSFLISKDYSKLIEDQIAKPKRKYTKRNKAEDALVEEIVESAVEAVLVDAALASKIGDSAPAPVEKPAVVAAELEAPVIEVHFDSAAEMPVEEMLAIITSQYTLAKYSAVAKDRLARIAEVLIS